MPTIDQTELGFLYPIETAIPETEKWEPETKKQQEMEKSAEPEMKKSSESEKSLEMKKLPKSDVKNPETENLLSETKKSTEPETKKPEMKQRPSTLSYSQPINAPVIVCSSTSLEQIIVQVGISHNT